jgi:hypothetical protein
MFTQSFFRAKDQRLRLLLSLLVLCCTGMITHAQTDDTTSAPALTFNAAFTCTGTAGTTAAVIPAVIYSLAMQVITVLLIPLQPLQHCLLLLQPVQMMMYGLSSLQHRI